MRHLIYLLLLFVFANCENNKRAKFEAPKITDGDIYEVINWVLLETKTIDSLEGNQVIYIVDQLSKPAFVNVNPNFKKELILYFSKEDLKFIDEQLKGKDFKLSQSLVKRKKLISKDVLDKMIDYNSKNVRNDFLEKYTKKYGNKYYDQFSLPIFSRDKKTVLIDVNSIFGGGYSLLLKKKGNVWEGKVLLTWVS